MKDQAYYTHPIFDDTMLNLEIGRELEQRSADRTLTHLGKAGKAANELEFPSAKSEAWRWTDFSNLDSKSYANLALKPAKLRFSGNTQGAIFMEFDQAMLEHFNLLNSYLGTIISPDADRFAALASVYANQGFVLWIPKGAEITEGLEVSIETVSAGLHFGHSLVVLEPGSRCKLTIHRQSASKQSSLTLENLEILLGSGAELDLVEIIDQSVETSTIAREKAKLMENSRMRWIYGHLGEGHAKHFIDIDLAGTRSEAKIRGFYFIGSKEDIDLDTQVNHLAANTKSDLLFKGAANGNGKVTWEGMIYVDPVAQGTDGYQANRNLALSANAEIHSIPGLEICADDVKCSHGATVGRIDAEELFYLESRGMPKDVAEKLIVNGFFAEVIDEIKEPKLHEQLSERINEKLSER
ncbi:MAG TPA: Fe-S cluster assembly protein SufD [Anaerolineaceae bacterium]|nr:Fe-S cluster assembly protein SufD [Anaerolineaceae bacterium]